MHAITVSILVTLARFAAVILAIPVITDTTAPLAPRSQFCDNAPTVVAGTSFDRHSLVPHNLIHRTEPVKVWCHPGGSTYITVALIHGDVPAQAFKFMLNAAMNRVINHLALYGNGLIPSGVFIQPDQVGFFELYLANSNNHQQTWGVVGAALSALSNFMVDNDSFSTSNFKAGVTFTVFDGANEVGQGSVS